MHTIAIDRRRFLQAAACGMAAPIALAGTSVQGASARRLRSADACIVIRLAGGVAQSDTWDPKPFTPFRRGMPGRELLSTCPSIETAAPGVRLGAGLDGIAAMMDRGCVLRSVTGRGPSGDAARNHVEAQHRLRTLACTDGGPAIRSKSVDHRPGELAAALAAARSDIARGVARVAVTVAHRPFEGFDTHDHGAQRLAALKRTIDRPIADLVRGLERDGLLDRTLVVVASEFGRAPGPARGAACGPNAAAGPAMAGDVVLDDAAHYGFHGHFGAIVPMVVFGGGVRRGAAIGRTADCHPMVVVEDAIRFDDVRATIDAMLGSVPRAGTRIVDAMLG